MFHPRFYHQSMRRYVAMFGGMFADLTVARLNAAGDQQQVVAVPLSYGPKELWTVRRADNPDLTRSVDFQLPRMSFELAGIQYAPSRQVSSVLRVRSTAKSDDSVSSQYHPLPYDLTFNLYAMAKLSDDSAQMAEQILPFFAPSWTQSVLLVPEMDITRDITTTLVGVSIEDMYEGDWSTRRALTHTYQFSVAAWFFGPVTSTGVIKRVQVDLGVVLPRATDPPDVAGGSVVVTDLEVSRGGRDHRIIVTPGMYANGSPTTNSAASISTALIGSGDNYAPATNTFFYADGMVYHPDTNADRPREDQRPPTRRI